MNVPDVSEFDVEEVRENFRSDSWLSLVGVGLGYGVVLAALFVLLFVVPYLVFSAL